MKGSTWLWLALAAGVLLIGGGAAVVVFTSRRDFVQRLKASLDAYRDRGGTPLPEASKWILLAQAAYETNWGATAAAGGHNYWNLSAGSAWPGPIIPGPDTEPDGMGGWRNITQAWRAYPDDLTAIDDLFSNWLTWSRYAPARRALLLGDRDGYLSALRAGGYFTQDLPTYQAGVAARLASARNLLSSSEASS